MTKIISPSLLASNFLNLQQEIETLNKVSHLWFHLDIMDGHFVPQLTFGHPLVKQLFSVARHPLDAHFMVSNPQFYLETMHDMGLYNVTFHVETTPHLDRFLHQAKKLFPKIGISFNPSTPLHAIEPYLFKLVDVVLIMSVNPGFGGQHFISSIEEKVKACSKLRHELQASFQIQVDGGINQTVAEKLFLLGADNLVVGSYLFQHKQAEYEQVLHQLRLNSQGQIS
jgi:ribulose-phosphate 3-epimerase